jgi:di/tricarboxylate transporter
VSDATITFLALGGVVALFVWGRVPVAIVAVATALALWATGVLELEQAFAGFGDPTVLFIAALFVVSEALDATGVTAWAGQELTARSGGGRHRLVVMTMCLVALLTALISLNGAVAALMPVAVITAVRVGRSPSQLLLPLAFAAHAGSLLALTGTPVNVIVSDAAADATGEGFGFFDFAVAGVPLLVGTIAIVILFGERLLPNRTPRSIPPDLSRHARTLAEQYGTTESLHRLRVREGSSLSGTHRSDVDLADHPGVAIVGVQTPGVNARVGRIGEGDVLVVSGEEPDVARFAAAVGGQALPATVGADAGGLLTRESGTAEVVIPPRSPLVGMPVFPGMATQSGDLLVLAVQRNGEDIGQRETTVAPGDVLLLHGSWRALDAGLDDPSVLVIDRPGAVRRQAVPLGPGAKRTLVVMGLMVVLLATGAVPAAVAGLLAAGAIVLTGVLTIDEAWRAISWTTVVLIGGLLPLSTAMTQTGAADDVADGLLAVVGDAGPYALVAGLFVVTAVLGQLISNMATALIMIPIGVSAAVDLDVSARPVLMAITVAAAAAFLTPVATPANMMVMGPGGYRFGDYWKLGLPILVLFFVVAVFLVPVVWAF